MAKSGVKSNIKQNTASQKSNSYLHTKFSQFQIQSVPDIGSYYYNEFKERVDEVKKSSSNVFQSASKIFSKIVSKKSTYSDSDQRKSGYEIARLNKTPEAMRMVQTLTENPKKHAARIALAASIIRQKDRLSLDELRRVMMQMAIPIGLGSFNVDNIKMLISAHRYYQHKLLEQYVRDFEKAESHLKHESQEGNEKFRRIRNNLANNKDMLSRMIEQRKEDPVSMESEFLQSLSLRQIDQAVDGTFPLPKGKTIEDVKEGLERNLSAIILSLLNVEFLHQELLSLSDVLFTLRKETPVPHFLQGRISLQRLKIAVIHKDYNPKVKPMVQERLQKTLIAFGNSLKTVSSLQAHNPLRKQIFVGHAVACLFAYNLRSFLGIPPTVFQKLLMTGKNSLEQSGLRVADDVTDLFPQYIHALTEQGMKWEVAPNAPA